MTIEEQITIFEHNAEHERKEGDLNNCLHFRQLAEWLKELKAHREAWEGLRHDVYELHEILFNMKPQHRTTTVAGDILDLINAYRPKEGDNE